VHTYIHIFIHICIYTYARRWKLLYPEIRYFAVYRLGSSISHPVQRDTVSVYLYEWVCIYINRSLCPFLKKPSRLIAVDRLGSLIWYTSIHIWICPFIWVYIVPFIDLDLGSFWFCTHPNTYSHIWTNHAPTFEWDMSHIWMHLSQIHMSHLWMCIICHTHVTHVTLWRHACARDMSQSHERTQTGGGLRLRRRVEGLTGFEGQVASQVTFYQNNTRPDTMTHDTSANRHECI